MSDWILVGRVGAPHGLDGAVRVWPETDFPERYRAGRTVYLEGGGAGPGPRPLVMTEVAAAGRFFIVRFQGVHGRDQAEGLRGASLLVPADQLPPLPPGHFYHHQVIGLSVVTEEGEVVGRVSEILTTGAHDVYVVTRPDGREALVPAVKEFVRVIDPSRGTLVLRPVPGLLEV